MFESFHQDARQVVVLAQEEARQARHEATGTEHLLLGLRATDGVAAQALDAAGLQLADLRDRVNGLHGESLDGDALSTVGIDLAEVRRATEANFGSGALDRPVRRWQGGHIRLSAEAKKSLELAVRAAVRRGDQYIGTGHLLLGVLSSDKGSARQLLSAADVDVDAMRRDVEARLDRPAA